MASCRATLKILSTKKSDPKDLKKHKKIGIRKQAFFDTYGIFVFDLLRELFTKKFSRKNLFCTG